MDLDVLHSSHGGRALLWYAGTLVAGVSGLWCPRVCKSKLYAGGWRQIYVCCQCSAVKRTQDQNGLEIRRLSGRAFRMAEQVGSGVLSDLEDGRQEAVW